MLKKIHVPTVIVGLLAAVMAAIAPMIAKHQFDWWTLIPAGFAAILSFVQKKEGSWASTMTGGIISCVLTAGMAINSPTPDWFFIIGGMMTNLALFLTHDNSSKTVLTTKNTVGISSDYSSFNKVNSH